MTPFALNLEKTNIEASLVSIEPALNGFGSMLLVAKDEGDPGVHEWVSKTRMKMSEEEHFRHKLVTIGLHYAIVPSNNWDSFEAYLEKIEQTPPAKFRENLLNSYAGIFITDESKKDESKPVDWDDILSSPPKFIAFLKDRFGEEHIDEEIETRAYEYAINPDAMKQLIVEHLQWFWTNHLKTEWERVRPMLEESVRAFNQLDLSGMSRNELARFVTGRDFHETKWYGALDKAESLVFVPNAHIGPYTQTTKIGEKIFIYFGARVPEGSEVRVPELDRAEIVSKLSALADETRLHILQMIAENGEMRSNEVMEEIKLSQPSTSRYLGQLTASGYLQERRVNGAKAYRLNRDHIEKTLKAVSAFLLDRS
jgi:ArsR family transcriptional regulator